MCPVYDGEFMGLQGAVSLRWPLLLKPQQGFVPKAEKKPNSALDYYHHITLDRKHSHLLFPAEEHHGFLPALTAGSRSVEPGS